MYKIPFSFTYSGLSDNSKVPPESSVETANSFIEEVIGISAELFGASNSIFFLSFEILTFLIRFLTETSVNSGASIAVSIGFTATSSACVSAGKKIVAANIDITAINFFNNFTPYFWC